MLFKEKIVLPPAYLAPVNYYACLAYYDTEIEQFSHYERQTYFNRCRIATANGAMDLVVPVEKPSEKTPLRDVRIANSEQWQTNHWRAIESAYFSSPFFEYFRDDLEPFYTQKFTFLLDFDQQIQQKMLELLNLPISVKFTTEFKKNCDRGIIDCRKTLHPKKNNVFLQNNFNSLEYYQVFEQKFGFLPNMSIIDLLFNMGNEAQLVLKNCLKTDKKKE